MKLQFSGFLSAVLLVTFDCDIELHGTNSF